MVIQPDRSDLVGKDLHLLTHLAYVKLIPLHSNNQHHNGRLAMSDQLLHSTVHQGI